MSNSIGITLLLAFVALLVLDLWANRSALGMKLYGNLRGQYILLLIFCVLVNLFFLTEKWERINFSLNGMQYALFLDFLPWSDARDYLSITEYFVETGDLHSATGFARGLGSLYLAVFHKMLNGNLHHLYVLICFLGGVSIHFAAWAVRKEFGFAFSFLLASLLSIAFYSYSGTYMTEALGFIFGNLGFCLIWWGVTGGRKVDALLGLFTLSIAMAVRPGALLLLPMLSVLLAHHFRKSLSGSRTFFAGVLVSVVALSTGSLVYRYVEPANDIAPGDNFPLVLYGLAAGNEDWLAVFRDHPHAGRALAEGRNGELYRLAFERFMQRPSDLFVGVYDRYVEFLRESYKIMYEGLEFKEYLYPFYYLSLLLLAISAWRFRPYRSPLLVLLIGIGAIFLSYPVVKAEPYNFRVFASTSSFTMALLIICVWAVVDRKRLTNAVSSSDARRVPWDVFGVSVPLLLLMVIGPVIVKSTATFAGGDDILHRMNGRDVASPVQHAFFRYNETVRLIITESGDGIQEVTLRQVRNNLKWKRMFDEEFAQSIRLGGAFTFVTDLVSQESLYLYLSAESLTRLAGKSYVEFELGRCVTRKRNRICGGEVVAAYVDARSFLNRKIRSSRARASLSRTLISRCRPRPSRVL